MLNIFVISVFIIFIITVLFYFKYNLHKSVKFMRIMPILVAFATFFFAYSSYGTVQTNNTNLLFKKDELNKNLLHNFINDNINFFIEHPELNYYYAELFGLKFEGKYQRNKYLENQISYKILNDMSIIIYTFYNEFTELNLIQYKINLYIKQFLKSPIFIENYYSYIKNYDKNSIIVDYLKNNFNFP